MSDTVASNSTPVPAPPRRAQWRMNLGLFVATAISVFATGVYLYTTGPLSLGALVGPAQFTASLLTILVAHELGHYVAARIHKVDASLPFFIPLPIVSPFGTMGAVIRMRGVIPTRRALLDIGASGPLAGMIFALPLYAWGVAHSHTIPVTGIENGFQLGESILIRVMDRLFAGPVPEGMDRVYSPIAYGAWGGMFVTMLNLLPVSQLDGGHVAFALFGPRQNRYAVFVHRAMLVFFFVIVAGHVGRDVMAGAPLSRVGRHFTNATLWLVWFQFLAILGTIAAQNRDALPAGALTVRTRVVATAGLVILGALARENSSWAIVAGFVAGLGFLIAMEIKGGVLRKHDLLDHPPTSADPLDAKRKAIAIVTLILFVLLFMPEPISM